MGPSIIETANGLLQSVLQRHLLSQYKRDVYAGPVLHIIQDTIREATGDCTCTVHLEGSVMHGTSLSSADTDFVVRNQGKSITRADRGKIKALLEQKFANLQNTQDQTDIVVEIRQKAVTLKSVISPLRDMPAAAVRVHDHNLTDMPAAAVRVHDQNLRDMPAAAVRVHDHNFAGFTLGHDSCTTEKQSHCDESDAVPISVGAECYDFVSNQSSRVDECNDYSDQSITIHTTLKATANPEDEMMGFGEQADLSLNIDIVFEWATTGKLVNEPEPSNPFEGFPQASYAVKALKLMKQSGVPGFVQLGGCKMESLVLWQLRILMTQSQGSKEEQEEPLALVILWNVLEAFLHEVDIPGSPANPNHAVRMRYIEDSISHQQPVVRIQEVMDLGSFLAAGNQVRSMLKRFKHKIISPLTSYSTATRHEELEVVHHQSCRHEELEVVHHQSCRHEELEVVHHQSCRHEELEVQRQSCRHEELEVQRQSCRHEELEVQRQSCRHEELEVPLQQASCTISQQKKELLMMQIQSALECILMNKVHEEDPFLLHEQGQSIRHGHARNNGLAPPNDDCRVTMCELMQPGLKISSSTSGSTITGIVVDDLDRVNASDTLNPDTGNSVDTAGAKTNPSDTGNSVDTPGAKTNPSDTGNSVDTAGAKTNPVAVANLQNPTAVTSQIITAAVTDDVFECTLSQQSQPRQPEHGGEGSSSSSSDDERHSADGFIYETATDYYEWRVHRLGPAPHYTGSRNSLSGPHLSLLSMLTGRGSQAHVAASLLQQSSHQIASAPSCTAKVTPDHQIASAPSCTAKVTPDHQIASAPSCTAKVTPDQAGFIGLLDNNAVAFSTFQRLDTADIVVDSRGPTATAVQLSSTTAMSDIVVDSRGPTATAVQQLSSTTAMSDITTDSHHDEVIMAHVPSSLQLTCPHDNSSTLAAAAAAGTPIVLLDEVCTASPSLSAPLDPQACTSQVSSGSPPQACTSQVSSGSPGAVTTKVASGKGEAYGMGGTMMSWERSHPEIESVDASHIATSSFEARNHESFLSPGQKSSRILESAALEPTAKETAEAISSTNSTNCASTSADDDVCCTTAWNDDEGPFSGRDGMTVPVASTNQVRVMTHADVMTVPVASTNQVRVMTHADDDGYDYSSSNHSVCEKPGLRVWDGVPAGSQPQYSSSVAADLLHHLKLKTVPGAQKVHDFETRAAR
ncbi:hypothetical protein CEUSTIGMA_g1156.t1 [Chlamydomonas eustigma]|uniref:Uncharacterized protein n=1 Tax=Chlamydomonas eustigma TaxID=1157962 RepID=A0A250WSA2_9CHLO|nr:hypothetical protein CEUSTIGMA_g1156.t1 [Chlamydomonas eustigma]|eukprot:GAX73704.1 hypothetical protein CEUSTIGMA_g1156.t1 [Chlamydomonas eustigma]